MTLVRYLLPFLLAISTLTGCRADPARPAASSSSTTGDSHAEAAPAGAASPTETGRVDIVMHRSGCFGRCPSYTLRLGADNSVEFSGERFTSATGVQHGLVVPDKAQDLRRLLQQPAIASLNGDYTPANAKTCGRWATDFASVKIEFTGGSFARQINHYLGCDAAPKELLLLEKAIDDAADSERWINAGVGE